MEFTMDILILAIIVLILGGAALYIYKAKKSGAKCIGCPDGDCKKNGSSGCGCGCGGEK